MELIRFPAFFMYVLFVCYSSFEISLRTSSKFDFKIIRICFLRKSRGT